MRLFLAINPNPWIKVPVVCKCGSFELTVISQKKSSNIWIGLGVFSRRIK